MIDGTRPVAGVFTASFAIRIGLLCLETVEKGSLLLEEHQHATQESRAGPFNRATFGWMNPLFFKGYRNVLSLPDMYKMDDDLDTDLLRNTMAEAWAKGKSEACLDPPCTAYVLVYLPFIFHMS